MVKFSIIIPVKEINDYVKETVPYIQALDNNEWELIILTNELCSDEWNDDRIKLKSSGKVGPAVKRDLGANYAIGEFLVFLDDDSYPKSNLLSIASSYFNDESIVAIGGPAITPRTDTFWQKVSGAVFLSKFSGGNPERYIPIGSVKEVDDWPSVNFIVRRKEFLEIGGFNSPYWPGEDTKLCLALTELKSKKILYIPELIVWHHRREGLVKHLIQVGAYGLHRGYFAKRYPKNSRKIKYFLPSILFIFTLVSIALITYERNLVSLLLIMWVPYLTALIKSFYDIKGYEGFWVAIFSIVYIVLTHIFYGYKFIAGYLTINLKSKLR